MLYDFWQETWDLWQKSVASTDQCTKYFFGIVCFLFCFIVSFKGFILRTCLCLQLIFAEHTVDDTGTQGTPENHLNLMKDLKLKLYNMGNHMFQRVETWLQQSDQSQWKGWDNEMEGCRWLWSFHVDCCVCCRATRLAPCSASTARGFPSTALSNFSGMEGPESFLCLVSDNSFNIHCLATCQAFRHPFFRHCTFGRFGHDQIWVSTISLLLGPSRFSSPEMKCWERRFSWNRALMKHPPFSNWQRSLWCN